MLLSLGPALSWSCALSSGHTFSAGAFQLGPYTPTLPLSCTAPCTTAAFFVPKIAYIDLSGGMRSLKCCLCWGIIFFETDFINNTGTKAQWHYWPEMLYALLRSIRAQSFISSCEAHCSARSPHHFNSPNWWCRTIAVSLTLALSSPPSFSPPLFLSIHFNSLLFTVSTSLLLTHFSVTQFLHSSVVYFKYKLNY